MRIEFDPDKNRRNIELSGLSFELAAEIDWRTATVGIDERRDYGETRYWVLGEIDTLLIRAVYTLRGDRMRVISLRRASRKDSMPRKPDPFLIDEECPELTKAEIERGRPAKEMLPPALYRALTKRKPGQRGPQKKPTKVAVTIRLDRDVVRKFKSRGAGWQTRINEVLRKAAGR